MNYATGYGLTPRELFTKFNTSKLYNTKKQRLGEGLDPNGKIVGAQVFTYCFQLVLNDVIDKNIIFRLPTKYEAYIEMQKVGGEEFVAARQNGAFKDVDFIKSGFTGAQIMLRYLRGKKWRSKPILVHKKLKNRITQNSHKRIY